MCWTCLWKYFCCCCGFYSKNSDNEEVEKIYMDIIKSCEENPPQKVVQALFDYKEAWCPDGDLQFSKGEYFHLLEDKESWLKVESRGGKYGTVPSNYMTVVYDKRWYFDDINSRLEAEILLSNKKNSKNAFLLRNAHHGVENHTHSLSILKDEDIFHHLRIYSQNDMFGMAHGNVKYYHTLNDLIEDCIVKGYISYPCVRENLVPLIDISEFIEKDLIDPDEIKLVKKLGEGRAAQIYKGCWNNHPVAIKKVKEPIELVELKKEASILKKCMHKNIVTMYGICVKDTMMIVEEFFSDGSIKDIMEKKEVVLNYRTLQFVGHQVASGMAYLEKRNYIHCDIAARNILIRVTHEPVVVKIADFGMARCLAQPVYVASNGNPIPIRWCAPEVLQFGKLSTKSDVWSYGIFLMELFTQCRKPYYKLISNNDAQEKIVKGYKMGYPDGFNIHKSDFKLMVSCWEMMPSNRPSFKSVQEYFEREGSKWKILENDKVQVRK